MDNNKLFIIKNVSLLKKFNSTFGCFFMYFFAKIDKLKRVTRNNSKMINIPLVGSEAKACTEVRSPERVIKVPSKLPENANIAKRTVQLLKTPRFSVTASE